MITLKKLFFLTCVLTLTTGNLNAGVIYQEDFTNDPSYTTSYPQDLYWDSTNHWYHATVHDVSSGEGHYYADSPNFALVTPQDTIIEFDINVYDEDWGNYPGVFFSNSTVTDPWTEIALSFRFTWTDSSYKRFNFNDGSGGSNSYYSGTVSENTWFHVKIVYNNLTKKANLTVTKKSSGAVFWDLSNVDFNITKSFNYIKIGQLTKPPEYGSTSTIFVDNLSVNVDSINVPSLVPSLYFPRIMESDGWKTTIGITNPQSETLSVDLTAYNSQGEALETVTFDQLKSHGSIYRSLDNIFHPVSNPFGGWTYSDIAWVRATSNKQLQGFAEYNKEDGSRRMLTEAIMTPSSTLYVPHVAEQTDYWWTEASVINTQDYQSVGYKAGPSYNPIADLTLSDHQQTLDLTQYYGDPFEPGTGVGKFTSSDPTIAGVEMFGRKGNFNTAAALTLKTLPSKTLYFTHIASNSYWWTGCAVYNITGETATVQVYGYDENGNLLGTNTVTIQPNTKKVALVGDFITTDPMPAYITMESDQNIIGFELFGGNTWQILAGFSVDGITSNSLYFNHIRVNDDEWTGISMINMGDSTAAVNLSAYDETGTLLAQNSLSIDPKAKKVDVVENLFGGTLPVGVSHVAVESSQPLAGFELVGDKAQTHLGGMAAIYSDYEAESQTIGTSGGTVSTGSATVDIPADAIPSDTEVTFSETPIDAHSDGVTELIGNTSYTLEPEGYVPDKPVTITIPLDQVTSGTKYAKSSDTLTIYQWVSGLGWVAMETTTTQDGTGLTANAADFSTFAVGPTINLPDVPIHLHLTDHSGKFGGSGWLILKDAPDFGFFGNESLKQTPSKASTEEIYNKLVQYYRNAASGILDSKTVYTKYVNLSNGYDLDLAYQLFNSRQGKDLWCFFIPSSNSSDITSACSGATAITYWTISMSKAEYANSEQKAYEIRTLNQQNPYTTKTDSATGQQSYFPGKTHYNSIAIDLPQNNKTEDHNPILLIHGINGTASYWEDIPYKLRKEGYRVYELFHGGCGIEDIPHSGTQVKEAVNYVYSQEGNHKLDVITHSYGGVITRWYCLETDPNNAGDKIDNLIMIAPPHHGSIAAAMAAEGDWLVIQQRSRMGFVKDIHMPIYRELTPGSTHLMKMGKRSFRSGIWPIVLAGSKPIYNIINYEGEGFGDGAVAVSSASLLNAGVPLGVMHKSHLGQVTDKDLFNDIMDVLDGHAGEESLAPFFYEHMDDVGNESEEMFDWFQPYQASLIVDTSGLNAASIEKIEIDPEWQPNSTELDLTMNPDTQHYYTRTLGGDEYLGLAIDLDGHTPRTCSVIVHYDDGGTETHENVELNACTTTIFKPVGGDGYVSYGNFAVTTEKYEYNGNWTQIVDNLNSEYRVADWEDLKDFYNSGGDLLDLFDGLGLTEYGDTAFVTRSGDQFYSSDRAYFATRHEHNLPSYYLAHDNIDNYLISLGSWYSKQKILMIKKSSNGGPPQEGLIAYYPFSGNANDESGNGNDGTVHGAVLCPDMSGTSNSAYLFDGDNDYIITGTSNSLMVSTEFTICAWVKLNSTGTLHNISAQGTVFDTTGNWEFKVLSDGTLSLTANNASHWDYSGELVTPISAGGISFGTWQHIAVVFESGQVSFYINGSLDSQVSYAVSHFNETNDGIKIGEREYSAASGDTDGIIDEFYLYNRALSPGEISRFVN